MNMATKTSVLTVLMALAYSAGATAQTYSINGLTTQEILIIGAGLDKLPREVTDQNNLYQRIQAQITQQNQAAAKAQADAAKTTIDKAVADAIAEKAKAGLTESPCVTEKCPPPQVDVEGKPQGSQP